MSEFINNVTRRKEILKNVLRGLHQGKSVDEVKAEFGELANEVSSAEIAEIEQMLINEGLPVAEIQNLCDVHVAVFREGLDDQRPPETIPGHPLHTLRLENQAALQLVDALIDSFSSLAASPNPAMVWTLNRQFEKLVQIQRHYLRKENLLFPYLETYGFQGPSMVMWGIHDSIRAQLKAVQTQLAAPSPEAVAKAAADFKKMAVDIQEMVYKEEKILFPAALQFLKESDWAAIRAQEGEFGYFLVTPGSDWQPVSHEELHDSAPAKAAPVLEFLPLQTGGLSLDQINLMLTHLPVDITFVDENDEVRYFSQTRERIFDRTSAIIGRKVQNCHPPQSVARVQHILDDFKAGQRDTADFWINMGGRFILIRYYAMRDASGTYRGTLEVTQDATTIRSLEGERRLMDD